MDQKLKQRLVGAAVVVVLAVIFLPMLLDSSGRSASLTLTTNIPAKPEGVFSSRVIPLGGNDEFQTELERKRLPLRAAQPEVFARVEPPKVASVPPATETGIAPRAVQAWAVQVGSFAGQDNAAKLQQRLIKRSYSAFIETTFDDEGKAIYRVRVGPELLRSAAQSLRDKVERDIGLKGIVISYP